MAIRSHVLKLLIGIIAVLHLCTSNLIDVVTPVEQERGTCGRVQEVVNAALISSEIEANQADDLYVRRCVSSSLPGNSPFSFATLTQPNWPASRFCKVFSTTDVTGYRSYEVSISLWNDIGNNNVNFGHPGLAFNVKDEDNFDFIYFRPHSSGSCYQIGWVDRGAIRTSSSASCANGPPVGRTWFNITAVIVDDLVRVYKDGVYIVEYRTRFSPGGSFGAIGANGYDNKIKFQNLKVKFHSSPNVEPPSCTYSYKSESDFTLSRCSGSSFVSTQNNHFVMTTLPGSSWPSNGFCQAVTRTRFSGYARYKISVLLYNEIGNGQANFGHPGVLFNAKDVKNYDVVYFRPHSSGACYQTGRYVNGVFTGSSSKACTGGEPNGQTWFQIEIHVQPGKADVFKDGSYITSIDTYFSGGGYVGVLVANGYSNTIFFKNLTVEVPH